MLIFAIHSAIVRRHVAHLRFAQVRRDMLHQVRVDGAAPFAGFEELQLKQQIIAMLPGKIGLEWIAAALARTMTLRARASLAV